jgi:intracellular septation protein A
VAAVTFNTSLSSNTRGAVNNSVVALDAMDLVLKKLNTASLVSVTVTVIVSALPESSDTSIDFITAVVAVGTVYNVVALVLVKSTFLFTKELAIMIKKS